MQAFDRLQHFLSTSRISCRAPSRSCLKCLLLKDRKYHVLIYVPCLSMQRSKQLPLVRHAACFSKKQHTLASTNLEKLSPTDPLKDWTPSILQSLKGAIFHMRLYELIVTPTCYEYRGWVWGKSTSKSCDVVLL